MTRCFQKRAPLLIVLSFFILQPCVAGAAPSSVPTTPSSSLVVEHGEAAAVHVRKLLTIGTVQTAAATATATATEVKTAATECSEGAVVVSQLEAGRLQAGGMATYGVTIANSWVRCAVRDVHVACGEFGLAQLVAPADFRRVAAGDCLVRGGAAIGPGETVAFRYSSLFQYHLRVASVSCSCRS